MKWINVRQLYFAISFVIVTSIITILSIAIDKAYELDIFKRIIWVFVLLYIAIAVHLLGIVIINSIVGDGIYDDEQEKG